MTSTSSSIPLLATKLYAPPPRANAVARSRLVQKIEQGLREGRPVTLLSAPAGSGKTTLLSHVLGAVKGWPVAWLSLDELDNDPVRFWTYVIAALQTLQPELGRAARALLQSPQASPMQLMLPDLINDIATLPRPVLLILDDYHVISTLAIHESMAYLLGHLPPSLHVVLATRVDPPLPMARMRANQQLVDVRAADVRFTLEEATFFLNQCMHLDLAPEDIETLLARTEGWVVGLQLAALAIQSSTSPHADPAGAHATIEGFSGDHHYVLEYLVEQVLSYQPEHVQQFLFQTSILDRMCGPLCDALLSGGEEERRSRGETLFSRAASPLLSDLERANLFVVPLDDRHYWYRYHHLFADLLRARLQQSQPERLAELHARAAEWYEQNGWPDAAIQHAIAGGDWERTTRLLQQNINAFVNRGVLTTVLQWIKALPREVAVQHPLLRLEEAWVFAFSDQMKEVEPLLRDVESAIASDTAPTMSEADLRRMRASVAILRAYTTLFSGDPQRAIEIAESIRDALPQDSPRELNLYYWVLGYAYRMRGDLERAIECFEQAVQAAVAVGDLWTILVPMTDLAIVYRLMGKLHKAADAYRAALRYAAEHGAANHGYLSRVESGLALVLLEQNELDEAPRYARSGVAKTQDWQSANHIIWSQVFLARVLMATGNVQEAAAALQHADEARHIAPVLPMVKSWYEATQVRVQLARGDLPAAERWAAELLARDSPGSQPSQQMVINESSELLLIVAARVLIAKTLAEGGTDSLDEALALLARLEASAQSGGRLNSLIEIRVLEAVARYHRSALGDETESLDSEALAVLEHSLQLGEPEGYVRVFVDEGEVMQRLLVALGRQAVGNPMLRQRAYLARLLNAFPDSSGSNAGPAPSAQMATLIEPLSDRELEILRLIMAGMSTQDMARKLIIAQGTVKAHVATIYRKLDVHSRTQAIAVARALGLLA